MPTEISLTTKIGQDLVNIKTDDFGPDQAVQYFSDLVTSYREKFGQQPAPQAQRADRDAQQYQQAVRSVETQLGAQPVQAPAGEQKEPCPQHGGQFRVRRADYRKSDRKPYVIWSCTADKDCKRWGTQQELDEFVRTGR